MKNKQWIIAPRIEYMRHLLPNNAPSSTSPQFVAILPQIIWQTLAILIGFLVLGFLVIQAMHVILLIFIAFIFAEGIRAPVFWLNKFHIPRPLAALLVYLILFSILGGLGWLLATPLINQRQFGLSG
jgi:predicted PurR-regulated permease PerM